MDEFNTYEYSAEQKSEGKWLVFKLLMIFAYIAFAGIYFLIVYITRFFPVGALIPVALWILIYFTWRYVNPDYTYTIEGGVFNYFVKYGAKKKKKRTSFKISSASFIGPLRDYKDMLPKHIYNALPSESATDAYIAIYENNGKAEAIKFVATKESLRLLRRHNSKTIVTETKY